MAEGNDYWPAKVETMRRIEAKLRAEIETLERSLRESWANEKRLADERDGLRSLMRGIKQLRSSDPNAAAIADAALAGVETTTAVQSDAEIEAELAMDRRIFGTSYHRLVDGRKVRISPQELFVGTEQAPVETGACNHHFSELLASKDNAFEMRQCLECAKIFRVRLPEKATGEQT